MAEQQAVFRNFGFKLMIGAEPVGFFLKVTGLGMSTEIIEYREGGMPGNVRKLPGRTDVNDITLEHGVANSASLWNWLDACSKGQIERRNVCIILLGTDGQEEVARWNLTNCWPSRSEISDFDARGNEVLLATVTLTTENLEQQNGASPA
ncbi:MAG: phage tail protein [Gammaproteobacteria bacterium]|nr:phage tail protein [Gammaproteobacteria bacterium]